MIESKVRTAFVLWASAWVLVAVTAAIYAAFPRDWRWGNLTGLTAILIGGTAMVLQIRAYCARVCGLIRVATGFAPVGESDEGGVSDERENLLRIVP